MTAKKEPLFDVVAVAMRGSAVRVIAQGKTAKNAEAITCTAVIRRGVDKEFFAEVPAGMYKDGDAWKGNGRT